MPPGLVITIFLFAACTLFALKPVRRPPAISTISFLLGVVFNEIPVAFFLYVLLPVSALTLLEGDIDSSALWLFGPIWLLLVAGLALIWRRQWGARIEVLAALDSGLGSGWRPDTVGGLGNTGGNRGVGEPLPENGPGRLRTLLAPFPAGRFDVKRVANQSYGDAGRRNLLDLYHHRSRPQGAPVLVYFHGGSFRSGQKRREGRPLILRLASQGWICISANYRLRPRASFPDYVVDAKKVIGWAKERGPAYGADPDSIFVAGSSAGAHIASIAGLTSNDPSFQPGFEDVDTAVSGMIGLYGYYGGLEDESGMPSSPLDYLSGSAPPAFLAHGDLDTVVRVEGARHFAGRLREVSRNPVVLVELAGAQHSFDLFHSTRIERVTDGIEAWAESVGTAARSNHL